MPNTSPKSSITTDTEAPSGSSACTSATLRRRMSQHCSVSSFVTSVESDTFIRDMSFIERLVTSPMSFIDRMLFSSTSVTSSST